MGTIPNRMKVLLIGKDGRTDALATACLATMGGPELFALTQFRSPGLLAKCSRVYIGSLADRRAMARVVREIEPDLVIVGPEEPLAAGIADELELMGIPCFGPHSSLARIETSKGWTRRLFDKHGITGNPRYRIFDSDQGVREYLQELGDWVVKPDGLTGGKGVKVLGQDLDGLDDSVDYINSILWRDGRLVIEERLEGEEFSLQSITDGESLAHTPVVQDHKRVYEGDKGPNTGGVGSYSCPDFSLPFLSENDVSEARRINEAVVNALSAETKRPYRGVLYGNFIATRDGVRLIEYNARFGDPEVLNLVPILQTDFVEVALAAATGELGGVKVIFDNKATVCKYVVPEGYPTDPRVGDEIKLQTGKPLPGLSCFWAAVDERDGRAYMTGARAVAFVGVGATMSEAESIAEAGAGFVDGPVMHRSDIGTPAAIDARIRHMAQVRATSQNVTALT
jgi:phosphoribosylamine---glycine ligase